MAEENKKSISALIIEFLIVLTVGLGILFFFLFGEPFKRGFYCDDESLRHPYKDSTVPSFYLYIVGFGLNLLAIILGEFLYRDPKEEVTVGGRSIKKWHFDCYRSFILFCFGAACSHLITDSLKYTIGRLRPHFYLLCEPIFKGTCNDPQFLHKYITDFTCSNTKITPRQLKEMRLSFPSGHSSFSMYTMLYFALYVGSRFKCNQFNIPKYTAQYVAVLSALLVAMSRVSDYKHHWSDVLIGMIIGSSSAVITGVFVAKLFVKKPKKEEKEPNQNGSSQNV